MPGRRSKKVLLGVASAALAIVAAPAGERAWHTRAASARLVSTEEIPDSSDLCLLDDHAQSAAFVDTAEKFFSGVGATDVYAQGAPARILRDTDPVYSSVAVDDKNDEVFLQDPNLWSIRVFSRLENTKPGGPPATPRRIIAGNNTQLQFNSSVYIDPADDDVYSVENDIGDSVVTFQHDANGDVKPLRKLRITHRGYAMAIDGENQEMFVSIQHPPQVAVYTKGASGNDKPKRLLIGDKTELSDTHGLAIDTKRKLLFVNNWGNIADDAVPGSGRFGPPSITVYRLDADGDQAPLRIIQGTKTGLDWPGAMSIEPDTGDLYVGNDMGQDIIVFHGTDQGDVAPARTIKGPRTGLTYPVGVFVDSKNKEVWASNLGNATATVYPLMANGDVAPLRIIRSAKEGKKSLRFGKTQALAYDSKREEILVPN